MEIPVQGDGPDQTYPLVLLSPASEKTVTSTLGELRTRVAALQIHPYDASARDLGPGDVAQVFKRSRRDSLSGQAQRRYEAWNSRAPQRAGAPPLPRRQGARPGRRVVGTDSGNCGAGGAKGSR